MILNTVRAAVVRAVVLVSGDARHEPAALFYALADTRRAFPFAWKLMAGVLAVARARAAGLELAATREQFSVLCSDVLHKRMTFDRVRAWFAARVTPVP